MLARASCRARTAIVETRAPRCTGIVWTGAVTRHITPALGKQAHGGVALNGLKKLKRKLTIENSTKKDGVRLYDAKYGAFLVLGERCKADANVVVWRVRSLNARLR